MSSPNVPSMLAGGTIRRCRFVKPSTTENHTVLEADANERTIGISQEAGREAAIPSVTADPPEAAQDGDSLQVYWPGDWALLEAGSGGWAAGARLKSDADGKGVAIASTGTTIQQIGAIAITAASEGELAPVMVVVTSERPALA